MLAFAFSSTSLRLPSQISSLLLYDLSNPTTRSYGFSMSTDLGNSGATLTWLSTVDHRPSSFLSQARRGGLPLDEPASLFSFFYELRHGAAEDARCGTRILGGAFSAPTGCPHQTNSEAHSISATRIFQSESLAEYPARRLSYLTPNAPVRGAGVRSTEASLRLAG